MSRPDYATTKSGLIAQVRNLHDALEMMTLERDEWRRMARKAAQQADEIGAQRDHVIAIAHELVELCTKWERVAAAMNRENN